MGLGKGVTIQCYCIVTKAGLKAGRLYRNTKKKKNLYCDLRARLLGTLGRWAGAERAGCGWGARAGVGVGRADVLQAREALGARSAQAGERQARMALGARRARDLGARAGCGLCTRCTRPIFDPF